MNRLARVVLAAVPLSAIAVSVPASSPTLPATRTAFERSIPDRPAADRPVLDRAPTAADGPPVYQQDMQWLDPSGRSWVMRDLGNGHATWLAEDPSARVVDEIGGARPAAAYGTLRLSASYGGPAFTVVNTVTKASADIHFLPDGTLDEVGFAGFCARAECRVSRWYDQGGEGHDAVQPNPAAQPTVRLAHRAGQPLSIVWDYEATSGAPARALVLPDALSIDSGEMAVLWTGRFHNAAMVSPLIELGVDADAFNFGYWDAHGDFYLGTHNHLSELPGHAALTAAIGLISSSRDEGVVTNYRNQTLAQGKLPSETHRGGFIGQTAVYKANGMMELSSLILYNRGLAPLERFVAVKALGENFSIPQQQRDTYVADGDSLTQGIATPYLQAYPWYMERLLPRSLIIYNAGWGGKTLGGPGGLLNRYDAFTAKLFNQQARHNVISLFAGTNDLQAGTDDQSLFRLVQQYVAAARKTGFRVVVATIIPRASFNAKTEAYRVAANAMLRAHWKEFADALADLAADPVFSDPKVLSNTTVYTEDGVHLTDFGTQLVAADMSAAVAPLLE
jgi:lysophospholipase L1-like esterase